MSQQQCVIAIRTGNTFRGRRTSVLKLKKELCLMVGNCSVEKRIIGGSFRVHVETIVRTSQECAVAMHTFVASGSAASCGCECWMWVLESAKNRKWEQLTILTKTHPKVIILKRIPPLHNTSTQKGNMWRLFRAPGGYMPLFLLVMSYSTATWSMTWAWHSSRTTMIMSRSRYHTSTQLTSIDAMNWWPSRGLGSTSFVYNVFALGPLYLIKTA